MSYVEVLFGLPVKQIFTYKLTEDQEAEFGYRIIAPFGRRTLTGYVIGKKETPPEGFEIKEVQRVIDKAPVFDKATLDLAEWVSKLYLCSHGEVLQNIVPGGIKPKSTTEFYDFELPETGPTFEPAEQQLNAIDGILNGSENTFYLNGVTGSGKTEVFLRVTKEMIARGKSVIYLVPEISLTHQVVEVFLHRFGRNMAIIHSALTKSQKLYEWMRILKGEVHLVIGARSAVFAPLKNLGLIIIDEEHEGSYKSSNTPRYHARQVAMYRIKREKAHLVMGSATPSLEAYYQIKEGNLKEFKMPERLSGGGMPEIVVVDMKKEKAGGALSKPLIREINRVHGLGKQTILFLNRRGFAYYFHCKSCGFEMKCKHCSVSLTFHKSKWLMVCHYCGYKTPPLDVCPSCNSLDIGYSGFGTERIEEEIKDIFPDLKVQRIDTDVVSKRHKLKEILTDFKDHKVDILLGTQMVAKGLNFPGVMLVGIISADTGLQLPDFRAAERTFGLIVQVSGRAGRVLPDGKVLIQTYQPQNAAIVLAAKNKVQKFYEYELAMRKELEFPPYERMVKIVFRGKDRTVVSKAIEDYCRCFPEEMSEFVQILGPVECPLAIISGNFRFHVIFKTARLNRLHGLINQSLSLYKKPYNIYLEIDIDPISLL